MVCGRVVQQNLQCGYFDLENEESRGQNPAINNDQLRTLVKSNHGQFHHEVFSNFDPLLTKAFSSFYKELVVRYCRHGQTVALVEADVITKLCDSLEYMKTESGSH